MEGGQASPEKNLSFFLDMVYYSALIMHNAPLCVSQQICLLF